jgi:DNA invertase Pin-like site-specific DNA recombinase
MKILYIRISTIGQNIDRQQKEGFDVVLVDSISGSTPLKERPEGKKLLHLVASGDVESISIHSIDRLGRNVGEIINNIEYFTSMGVCVISEKEGVKTLNADGSVNPIAKLIISVLGSIAEFELQRIKERTREGIDKAKKKGDVYLGRSVGSSESMEVFFSKAKNQKILKTLNAGYSLRQTALLCKSSLSLVVKVRDLANECGSLKNAVISSTKTQLTNEQKLRLFVEKEGLKV